MEEDSMEELKREIIQCVNKMDINDLVVLAEFLECIENEKACSEEDE